MRMMWWWKMTLWLSLSQTWSKKDSKWNDIKLSPACSLAAVVVIVIVRPTNAGRQKEAEKKAQKGSELSEDKKKKKKSERRLLWRVRKEDWTTGFRSKRKHNCTARRTLLKWAGMKSRYEKGIRKRGESKSEMTVKFNPR